MDKSTGFRITFGKGFHIKFANGYKVSVQWGIGNYCDNRCSGDEFAGVESFRAVGEKGSPTAECAVFDPKGAFMEGGPDGDWGDDVKGYMTPDEVLELMNKVAKL